MAAKRDPDRSAMALFADEMRAARDRAGLTQDELAARVNYSTTLVAMDLTVTPESLVEKGLIRKSKSAAVVILGQGDLKKSLTVNAHRFSSAARQKIEAANGKAEVIEVKKAE